MKTMTLNRDILLPLEELRACNICPRKCNADRFSAKRGYCRAGAGFSISSICIHRGEEPVISGSRGICNIFFTNCNLQCVYCQNWQISDNSLDHRRDEMSLDEALLQIMHILDTGINILGFVSPGHFIPQVKVIVNALGASGYHPVIVYNSNGYDDVEQLKRLEGMVDVYLPDFKYMDAELAQRYSDAADYPAVALAAHREMFRQMGSNLIVDAEGYAMRGMLIRHLVLPGHTANSISVVETIAEALSPRVHIALMSQYYPCHRAGEYAALQQPVSPAEYGKVVRRMHELGITRGFIQGIESSGHYLPDFGMEHPFEEV
jgi:putative pyruvate formate lyase activating enzyme